MFLLVRCTVACQSSVTVTTNQILFAAFLVKTTTYHKLYSGLIHSHYRLFLYYIYSSAAVQPTTIFSVPVLWPTTNNGHIRRLNFVFIIALLHFVKRHGIFTVFNYCLLSMMCLYKPNIATKFKAALISANILKSLLLWSY